MSSRRQYRKKPNETVVAVQLNLDTSGFTYNKWGDTQVCKPGDWLVNNRGDIYTIDQQTFSNTYEEVSKGLYCKPKSVWAEKAAKDGTVKTKEGSTAYVAGDYIVFNDEAGEDVYAVRREEFEAMYEPVTDDE